MVGSREDALRSTLEALVKKALKDALAKDFTAELSEAELLREEVLQLHASLAEVKRVDDAEIARLWKVIEDLEVDLAGREAPLGLPPPPPGNPLQLHAQLEGTRAERAALRLAERRVEVLEAEAVALRRQQEADREERRGLLARARALARQHKKELRKARGSAGAAQGGADDDEDDDDTEEEEGELPGERLQSLLMDSVKQQIAGTLVPSLLQQLVPQLRAGILAAVAGAAPPAEPLALAAPPEPAPQPRVEQQQQPPKQAKPQAKPQEAAATATATARPPSAELSAAAAGRPGSSSADGSGRRAAADESPQPSLSSRQRNLLSSLPPPVLPNLFPTGTRPQEALSNARRRLACPPCQTTFASLRGLARHFISPEHLEVVKHTVKAYTGGVGHSSGNFTKGGAPSVILKPEERRYDGACVICMRMMPSHSFLHHLFSLKHRKACADMLSPEEAAEAGYAASPGREGREPEAKKQRLR